MNFPTSLGSRESPYTQSDALFREEWRNLSRESDTQLFYEGVLDLARRQESEGRLDLATDLYTSLLSEPEGPRAPAPALRRRAQAHLDAIGGRGALSSRAEFLMRSFAQQASDPAMLFAMGTAGTVFRMTRLATLSRLATSSSPGFLTQFIGAGRLASIAGFALEAPTFTIASRLGGRLLGRPSAGIGQGLGREIASSYLMLGSLRLSAWSSAAAYQRFGGTLEGMAAKAPLAGLFRQSGMLAGIMLSHGLEEHLGLRHPREGGTLLVDSLATLLQFNVAGRLSQQVFGSRWTTWERRLDLQSEALSMRPIPPRGLTEAGGILGRNPELAMVGSSTGISHLFGREPGGPILPTVLQMSSQEGSGAPGSTSSASGTPGLSRLVPAAEGKSAVERVFGSTSVEVSTAAGHENVQRLIQRMSPHLPALRELLAKRPPVPWFIAGVSDGMGLHSAVALMEAGVRHLVGGFYEPEALIRMESPVHLGRLANVEGLRILAQERGVEFHAFYEDLVLPQHGKPARPFPESIREAILESQRQAGVHDLNFVNSIAFARWISPSPGVEQLKDLPSLDLEGRVILMNMRPYQAKGYEGTLDSMGRNHGALLETLGSHFGPHSTSFFFTWAGGSQNRRVLNGVYGGGSLGHAKEIGETDAIRYHLRSLDAGFAQGHHKIVRFPDFPSFALFGIPGGGAFGMIARHVLESHGCYADMADLAPRAYLEAFGVEHNLRNPAAQIELDGPESYHLPEIRQNLETFYERVREYRKRHPEWDGSKALDIETSRELLRGLVSENYAGQIPQATE